MLRTSARDPRNRNLRIPPSCLVRVTIGLHDYTYGEWKAVRQKEELLCLRQSPVFRNGENKIGGEMSGAPDDLSHVSQGRSLVGLKNVWL